MGFVTVTMGFFLFQQVTLEGALIQMISLGLVSSALFLCIGILYDRPHFRQIADYGGVVNTMPRFAALFDQSQFLAGRIDSIVTGPWSRLFIMDGQTDHF